MRLLAVMLFSVPALALLGSQEPAADAGVEQAAGEVPEVMEYDYTLQFVSLDFDTGSPRSPYDERANRCLLALPTDSGGTTTGGIGLGYGHCPHYPATESSTGAPVGDTVAPAPDMLWNFFEDGRIRNKRTGWCIRRMECDTESIYDLGPCDQPAAGIFNVWKARSNRADMQEYVGLPLKGVDNPCSLCGPFILKQRCGTEETAMSCNDKTVATGWTKKRVMLKPQSQEQPYTTSFGPSLKPICGTWVQGQGKSNEDLNRFEQAISGDAIPPWYFFHKYENGHLVL